MTLGAHHEKHQTVMLSLAALVASQVLEGIHG